MTKQHSSVIEDIRIFEEQQEQRLERAKDASASATKELEQNRATELKTAEETLLKEKQRLVAQATEQAKEDASIALNEYSSRAEELKAKSSKNEKDAIEKCYALLLEE
ncbi:hypothetical protein K8R43_05935 [archaeon]|nr:hypothetical protein [archaeon]